MKPGLRVLFLAAEADPFIKVGGLGDVAGSLPAALRRLSSSFGSVDVRLALPLHGAIRREAYPLLKIASFSIPYEDGSAPAEAWSMEYNGLPVYFISGPLIPSDAPVYTPDPGVDGVKFTFFSLAALELARILNWIPHIVHANDWHTAPAIYALSRSRDHDLFYYNTSSLLSLHNLPYLGVGAGPALAAFGLPPATGSSLPVWAQDMPLPLALLTADHIVAVSPTYAQEIMTPEFGSGLQDFLRTRAGAISGILNGLDEKRWDPANDPALASNYSRAELPKRQANKAALQQEFGLAPDPHTPLFAMVTRMDHQKGVDLVPPALRQLTDRPWQAILLGTGDRLLEANARSLETSFPEQARAAIRFDANLSRRIYAGADALLIPSRYEPCGLTQMIAMRYGCVPIARATGGLRDTIQDFGLSTESTGFLFGEASPDALADTLRRAILAFHDPIAWQGLQQRGMAQDLSWHRFAKQYLSLYETLTEDRIKSGRPL